MVLPLANAAVACALAGLIWTIQVVHYPLFAHVGEAEWTAYEREHQRRITLVVAPLMLANVALAAAVVVAGDGAATLRAANLALAAGVFAATGLVYSPLHGRLGEAHDPGAIHRLVALNWWRTAAWTAQAAVSLALVASVAVGAPSVALPPGEGSPRVPGGLPSSAARPPRPGGQVRAARPRAPRRPSRRP